jgi:hypothetical protein
LDNTVNVNDPIILQGFLPVSSEGQELTSFVWSIPDVFDGVLSSDMLLSSISQSVLILKPGSLVPGRKATFQVQVGDNFGDSGIASISVQVRIPPYGGGLSVSPQVGHALKTPFTLMAFGWTANEDSLPLMYTFSVAYSSESVIVSGMTTSTVSFLPPGDKLGDFLQTMYLDVLDSTGGMSRATSMVNVYNFEIDSSQSVSPTAALGSKFKDMYSIALNDGKSFEALFLINTVAVILNDVNTSCHSVPASSTTACAAGNECCEKKALRSFLLKKIQETSESLPNSQFLLQNQASILLLLTSRPAESDFNFIESCAQFLLASIQTATQTLQLDSVRLSKIYGQILDQLFFSLSYISEGSRRGLNFITITRRNGIPDARSQNLVKNLVESISMISLLSVKDSRPAQLPFTFSSTSFSVYISRIFLSQIDGDLQINLNGTSLSAKVPKTFFTSVDPTDYDAVDIILAISYAITRFLPSSLGPFVILQASAGLKGISDSGFSPPTGWGEMDLNVSTCLFRLCTPHLPPLFTFYTSNRFKNH